MIVVRTTLRVNNTTHELSLDSRLTLLDALRGVLGLTSTKKGCNHGACGACTVIIEGQRVLSCLTLAAACEGQHVVTIEGLGLRRRTSCKPPSCTAIPFTFQYRLLHAWANPVGRLRVQEVHAGLPSHVTQDVDNRSAAQRCPTSFTGTLDKLGSGGHRSTCIGGDVILFDGAGVGACQPATCPRL